MEHEDLTEFEQFDLREKPLANGLNFDFRQDIAPSEGGGQRVYNAVTYAKMVISISKVLNKVGDEIHTAGTWIAKSNDLLIDLHNKSAHLAIDVEKVGEKLKSDARLVLREVLDPKNPGSPMFAINASRSAAIEEIRAVSQGVTSQLSKQVTTAVTLLEETNRKASEIEKESERLKKISADLEEKEAALEETLANRDRDHMASKFLTSLIVCILSCVVTATLVIKFFK